MNKQQYHNVVERFRENIEKQCREKELYYRYLGALDPNDPHTIYFLVEDESYSLRYDGDEVRWQYEGPSK